MHERDSLWLLKAAWYVAGLTARTILYWQTVNWFGYFGYPMSERPWQNKQIWDWSACCSDQITQNGFFGILGAVFGYTVRLQDPLCNLCKPCLALRVPLPLQSASFCTIATTASAVVLLSALCLEYLIAAKGCMVGSSSTIAIALQCVTAVIQKLRGHLVHVLAEMSVRNLKIRLNCFTIAYVMYASDGARQVWPGGVLSAGQAVAASWDWFGH